MANLETLPASDHFMVRIYKHHSLNPDRSWVNTYEFRNATAKTDITQYAPIIVALVEFERQLHFTTTQFSRAVLSSWVPDGTPYTPESFYITELQDSAGARLSGGQELPLNYVLRVKREVEFGRSGHIQYRNCLSEADSQSLGGIPFATSPTGLTALLNTAMDESLLEGYLAGGAFQAQHTLSMVRAVGNVASSRVIMGLTYGGINVVKYNHKYFNRL